MAKTLAKSVTVHPYEALSKRLRVLRFALIFLLIAFLLGGLFVLRTEFTAENLRFLLRDLDFSTPTLGLDASGITFDYDTTQSTALYKGDLAILRRSALEIYTFSGSRSLSVPVAYSSPALVTGEKYLLAYDIGGNKMGVYNAFSELYTETFDYPIATADIADDGTFLVVSAEKLYHSALYVYSANSEEFTRTFRFRTADKVIYDARLCREDSSLLAVAAVSADNGDYLTQVILLDSGSEEKLLTISIEGEMPLELSFEQEGRICLLTDRGLHRIDTKSGEDSVYSFLSEDLAGYHTGEGYEVLILNSGIIGTALDVHVFSGDNSQEPDVFSVTNQVLDTRVAHGCVYLLSYDALTVFDLDDKDVKTHKLDHEYKEILPMSGGRLAFVGEGSVSIYMVG